MGCGHIVKTWDFNFCFDHSEEAYHVHDHAILTDITACINPDVVVDMHNAGLWQGISNNRLDQVLDHTNMPDALFENAHSAETLEQIYRVLKPGGYFEHSYGFDKHLDQLRAAGFTRFEGKKAFKSD